MLLHDGAGDLAHARADAGRLESMERNAECKSQLSWSVEVPGLISRPAPAKKVASLIGCLVYSSG